ncbi:hypothetical protein HYW20_08725 [Candidatus Woesearchaeota archaeon]|nr:hypothetical protein [Candidatus Woesearchaeota archaeon]
MPPSLKEIIKYLEDEGLPKDKSKVKYAIDKSFIVGWLEGTDDDSKATKVFVDLLGFVKKNKIPMDIFLPVDVLIALKKDKKKYVSSPTFIRMINSLFSIIEVDPSVEMDEIVAVKEVAEEYSKIGYTMIILTLDKDKYTENIPKIYVKKPEDILLMVAFFCAMFEPLYNLFETWFEEVKEE